MRSLRLVLSLALIDCLYCHFSGTKGHFISMASCRREVSSAHSESTGNMSKHEGFLKLSKNLCIDEWTLKALNKTDNTYSLICSCRREIICIKLHQTFFYIRKELLGYTGFRGSFIMNTLPACPTEKH